MRAVDVINISISLANFANIRAYTRFVQYTVLFIVLLFT